jgi:hypothetical protein
MVNGKRPTPARRPINREPGKIRFGCEHMSLMISLDTGTNSIMCDNPNQEDPFGKGAPMCMRVITGGCNFIEAAIDEPIQEE